MKYSEEDYLPLSGIQHFAFCRRQWALIHIENQWAENERTVDGIIMHEKAHSGDAESRGDVVIMRALRVFSATLGISGECDVVEFNRNADGISLNGHDGLWQPYPVEYKLGKPKEHNADESSSAHRRCVWRKCCAARYRAARCSTANRAAAPRWSLRRNSAGRWKTALTKCTTIISAAIRPRPSRAKAARRAR